MPKRINTDIGCIFDRGSVTAFAYPQVREAYEHELLSDGEVELIALEFADPLYFAYDEQPTIHELLQMCEIGEACEPYEAFCEPY